MGLIIIGIGLWQAWRMNARLEHRHPEQDADREMRHGRANAGEIEHDQDREEDQRKSERAENDLIGVENRDDGDCAQVIHDRNRHQKSEQ